MTPKSDISVAGLISPGATFAFGENIYSGGDRFGPLTGRQLEVVWLRSGQVRIEADDEVFTVTAPGTALVATRRHLDYSYGPQELSNAMWCQYVGPGLSRTAIDHLCAHRGPLALSETCAALMRTGVNLPFDAYDTMPEFVSALALALVQEQICRRRGDADPREIAPQAALVRRYIEDNLARPLSMGILAQVSNLSPQHLNRLFRGAYGENPLEYVWRLRTRQGAFLLQHTGARISQIAYRTGFSTPNHFSRHIRKRYGLSPRELRARGWRRAPD